MIYADTDAMGIVYHTNYIRWFEIGRTELFRGLGIAYRDVESEGYSFPLTQAYCHYHLPARYDDLLFLETDIDFVKRASIKFVYKIWDEDHSSLLTEGYTVHACMDRKGKVIRLPALITDKLGIYI